MKGAGSASEVRGSERVGALAVAGSAAPAGGSGRAADRPRPALLIRRVVRRLPPRARRVLRATYRRSQRLAGQMRRRWHRSLQLRVVATTMIISVVVVAALGFFLDQQIIA